MFQLHLCGLKMKQHVGIMIVEDFANEVSFGYLLEEVVSARSHADNLSALPFPAERVLATLYAE